MNNAIIIGTGKIGIDLYIKLKRINIFDKILIFNRNKHSEIQFFASSSFSMRGKTNPSQPESNAD